MMPSLPYRILWPYGLERVIFSVLAVFSAVGLYLASPRFAESPTLFAGAALLLFAVEVPVFEFGLVRLHKLSISVEEAHQARQRFLRLRSLASQALEVAVREEAENVETNPLALQDLILHALDDKRSFADKKSFDAIVARVREALDVLNTIEETKQTPSENWRWAPGVEKFWNERLSMMMTRLLDLTLNARFTESQKRELERLDVEIAVRRRNTAAEPETVKPEIQQKQT